MSNTTSAVRTQIVRVQEVVVDRVWKLDFDRFLWIFQLEIFVYLLHQAEGGLVEGVGSEIPVGNTVLPLDAEGVDDAARQGARQRQDWPDINIFRWGLLQMLDPNERVEADDGYIGEDPATAKVPRSMAHDPALRPMRSVVRRCHETADKRIKQSKTLNQVFPFNIHEHGTFFRAAVACTQLAIIHDKPLFSVHYEDPSIPPPPPAV